MAGANIAGFKRVAAQLHRIMNTIYQMSVDAAAEYGLGYNLVAGANIAGFKRVAEAMMERAYSEAKHPTALQPHSKAERE